MLSGGERRAVQKNQGKVDYSEWLLPTVQGLLGTLSIGMREVNLLAVCTGPGSFTGLRVGLTSVKAWAEVYGKPVVGVSRLEAMASLWKEDGLVAACYDAQRGQLFGGMYRSLWGRRQRIEDELVIAPDEFLAWVGEEAGKERASWVSLDAELITGLPGWKEREERGDRLILAGAELTTAIGKVAEERFGRGEFSDPLELDANYVRRSDAEIFWKGPGGNAG